MCLYPKLIENRKYTPTIKNNGKPPLLKDQRTKYVPIGCGNCIECRKQKSRAWQVRLSEEIKNNKTCHFITLTFSNESLNNLQKETKNTIHEKEQNEIATLAIRRFLERWRKKYKKSLQHWFITELGHTGTERIHLHGLIWHEKEIIDNTTGEITQFKDELNNIWQYGFTDTGKYVNEKTINYIVKYVNKIDKDHKTYKSKILCSKGIGKNYLNRTDKNINKFNDKQTKEYYITSKGLKLNLPTYYRNKIYTENEREKLWLNKIDKNERYICGEKIDISTSEDDYYNCLEFYRLKNKRLGYGDDSEEWNIKTYKNMRKLLKKPDYKNRYINKRKY